MVILHICYINNNKASGISNVVPEHFINQQYLNSNVGILNCNNLSIDKLKNEKNSFNINDLIKYNINSLVEPFNNPDLVVFHDFYISIYIKIYKKLKKNNIPYIIIPHGALSFEAQKIKYFKKKIANMLLFNRFIDNSLYLQFLSEDERKKSIITKHKSFVLGNGVSNYLMRKKTFNKESIKLLYIGRYSIHTKGIDILLESCLNCKEIMEKNNITLDLYGANPRSENGYDFIKKYIINYGLENVVNLHGPIYDDEKIQQYLSHDLFIQMSRHEGQPLGIMEAMMIGLPIIASNGTTFASIINQEKCGFICSSSESFESVIMKVLNERDKLNIMSNNSFNYAKNNFSWNVIAKKTLDKYLSIID